MISYVIIAGIAALALVIPIVVGVSDIRQVALAALFISAPLEVYRTEMEIGNLSVFRVVLVVATVVAVRERGSAVRTLVRRPIPLTVAVLLLVMALSLLFVSENRRLGMVALGQGALVLLVTITTAALASGIPLRSILRLACLGVPLPVLAAAAQGFYAYSGNTFGLPLVSHLPVGAGLEVTRASAVYLGDGAIRLKGTFGDPNHFAVWLVFMLAASIATAPSWFGARRSTSLAGLIWCAGILTVLLGTYSRTGWLCAAVAAAIPLVLVATSARAPRHIRLRRAWAVGALLIAVVAVGPLAPKIAQRLDNEAAVNRISNESHAKTTRVAYEEFLAHPVAGIGLSELGPRLGQEQRTSGAHSSYLTIASELGLPGLLAVLALLFFVARAFLRAPRPGMEENMARLGLFCAYVGFIVANAVYDLFWDDFHWVFVGAALALAAGTAPAVERRVNSAPRGVGAGADEHQPMKLRSLA